MFQVRAEASGFKMKGTIFCVLMSVAYVLGAEVRVDPLVLIGAQGLVRGQKSSDGSYSNFLGIPYAQVDMNNPFGVSDLLLLIKI